MALKLYIIRHKRYFEVVWNVRQEKTYLSDGEPKAPLDVLEKSR